MCLVSPLEHTPLGLASNSYHTGILLSSTLSFFFSWEKKKILTVPSVWNLHHFLVPKVLFFHLVRKTSYLSLVYVQMNIKMTSRMSMDFKACLSRAFETSITEATQDVYFFLDKWGCPKQLACISCSSIVHCLSYSIISYPYINQKNASTETETQALAFKPLFTG